MRGVRDPSKELKSASAFVPPTTRPNTVKPPLLLVASSEEALSTRLKKNWLVAELGSEVLAMAIVPAALLMSGPIPNSLVMGARVTTWPRCSLVVPSPVFTKPPPWMMKLGTTRWKNMPE